MITEKEAKTKWCPLVRVGGPMQTEAEGTSANRWAGQSVTAPQACDYLCIGSACMAWRTGIWDHQRNLKPEDRTPGVGYCGAFGRPA